MDFAKARLGFIRGARGGFSLYGAHDAGKVPHGVIPIRIEAGLASAPGITRRRRCA